jgi:predicted nucleic acid-binding protein
MKSVFIDTGGFYAALNRKDVAHREAHWALFTTNFVVAEAQALILIRRGRHRAWQFLHSIYTGSTNLS